MPSSGADRTQYEKDVQEHEQLVGLLSRQDWKLLRWSDRRLVKLAAQEGLGERSRGCLGTAFTQLSCAVKVIMIAGPAAFDEATSSPELKLLLRQRQRAWVLAHQIVKQWNSLVVHRAFLETSCKSQLCLGAVKPTNASSKPAKSELVERHFTVNPC